MSEDCKKIRKFLSQSASKIRKYRECGYKSTQVYLEKFNTKIEPSNNFSETKGIVRTLANVVWPICIGWILALSHLIAGLLNILGGVLFCWTLVGFAAGIVNARVHFRMIPASFAPFGRIIISSDVAKRLNEITTEKAVDEIIG